MRERAVTVACVLGLFVSRGVIEEEIVQLFRTHDYLHSAKRRARDERRPCCVSDETNDAIAFLCAARGIRLPAAIECDVENARKFLDHVRRDEKDFAARAAEVARTMPAIAKLTRGFDRRAEESALREAVRLTDIERRAAAATATAITATGRSTAAVVRSPPSLIRLSAQSLFRAHGVVAHDLCMDEYDGEQRAIVAEIATAYDRFLATRYKIMPAMDKVFNKHKIDGRRSLI